MNKAQIELIEKEFNIKIDKSTHFALETWFKLFKKYNEHTNLISKNDLNFIFEKHIFDSFGLLKLIGGSEKLKILDIGTGGGFPSLILAICFKNFTVIALDSIKKKTDFIMEAKKELKLDNLTVLTGRSENIAPINADLVVSRAVGKILKVYEFSKTHIKKGGKFIIYKAINFEDELLDFKKKYPKKDIKIENYELPTEEKHKRCVIVIK